MYFQSFVVSYKRFWITDIHLTTSGLEHLKPKKKFLNEN